MAKVNPPMSSAVVEIADDLVERYEAQGWARVKAKAEPESPKTNKRK